MRVFEVMSERVRTVRPTTSAAEAREIMRIAQVHHLVVTENSHVVGVLADRDLADLSAPAATVADVMAADVVTVKKTDTIRKAANLMQGRTIGCLPVIDRGHLVGIVTTCDLLRIVGQGVDRPARKERRPLNYRVPHRKTVTGSGRW